MVTKNLFRSAPHPGADPARRLAGVAGPPLGSDGLCSLLAGGPAPEVRLAAANRCVNASALSAAWTKEADPAVRFAISSALGSVLARQVDAAHATEFIASDACTDSIRAEVARATADAERRGSAIAAIREEAALIELALSAPHAETRLAAAERVHSQHGLRQLADAAENKDRGVARFARKRIDAIANREGGAAEADAILDELEALANKPGPILSAVVDLNRRWEALKLADDPARLARCDAARLALQARFDREHEEQRARARFERSLNEWLAKEAPAASDILAGMLGELATLREAAGNYADASALKKLDEADQRIERWTQELHALAGPRGLGLEARPVGGGTSG